jgi:hypothetical protein
MVKGRLKMKKLNLLYILIFAGLAFSFAADPIAIVIKARGDARVELKENGKKVNLKKGMRLSNGDKITTGAKSFAAIKFIDDGSLVRVRAKSNCVVKAHKEKNSWLKSVYVAFGAIYSKVTRQKSRFRVSTPTSVASVKGTEWETLQDKNGRTLYIALGGFIEISNASGVVLLKKGETCHVESSNTKPVVRKSKPGEGQSGGSAESSQIELNFEKTDGSQKTLRFKVKEK